MWPDAQRADSTGRDDRTRPRVGRCRIHFPQPATARRDSRPVSAKGDQVWAARPATRLTKASLRLHRQQTGPRRMPARSPVLCRLMAVLLQYATAADWDTSWRATAPVGETLFQNRIFALPAWSPFGVRCLVTALDGKLQRHGGLGSGGRARHGYTHCRLRGGGRTKTVTRHRTPNGGNAGGVSPFLCSLLFKIRSRKQEIGQS